MFDKLVYSWFLVLFFLSSIANAQSFKYAHISDTHIGNPTAEEDLRRTVKDINENPEIKFAIVSGDITEFGSDEEIRLAKQILDSMNVKYHIIPGNHDTNWSESGGNTFKKVFGAETFSFKYEGYHFVGTNCGPNMRMSPGQVPRENLVWLDSLFAAEPDKTEPLIFVNHYPLDSGLNNWYEVIDRIKTRNVQLAVCGHGHNNRKYEVEGIPAIMGRSNLRAKDEVGGYNIVTIADGEISYQERNPGVQTKEAWVSVPLVNHQFQNEIKRWPRPDYSVNEKYTNVNVVWTYEDDSDIGAGMAQYKDMVIAANTAGQVYALGINDGKKRWTFTTEGKIYSTPDVWKDYVVVGSSDNFIYCLSAKTGELLWKSEAGKAVLGSPIIEKGIVYIGASDEKFRALDLKSGKVLWTFDDVQGYVSTKPLYYQNTIYFGSWKNGFYALNPKTGGLNWEWDNGATNRMFSAAAAYPVGVNGRVFVVAPDRHMTALNAKTGEVIWRKQMEGIRVRESMGLSADGSLVYVKTMDGELLGISTTAADMEIAWRSRLQLPYELTPSAIVANGESVLVPNHNGLVSSVNAKSGEVEWQHKISNAMVNPILPIGKNKVLVSSMDGKIVYLNVQD